MLGQGKLFLWIGRQATDTLKMAARHATQRYAAWISNPTLRQFNPGSPATPGRERGHMGQKRDEENFQNQVKKQEASMLQENTKMLERNLSDKQSIKLNLPILQEKEETTTREQEVLPKVQSARKTMIEEVTEGNESDEFTKCFPDWSRQVFIDPYEVRMLERRKREAEERRKEEVRERTRLAAEQQEREEREEKEKRTNDEAEEEKRREALKEVLLLPEANQEISLSFQEEIQEPHFEMSKSTQEEANHDKETVLIEALEDILSKLKLLTDRVDALCEVMPAECLDHTEEDVATGEAKICLVLKNQPQQQGLYTTKVAARNVEILFIPPNKDGVDTVQMQEETGICVAINSVNEIFPHGTVKNAEEEERESCEFLKEDREDAEEISRDCKGKTEEGVKFNNVDLNCYEDRNYANSCSQEEMPVILCTKVAEERGVQCNIGEVDAVIQIIEQQNDPDTPHMTEKPFPQNREECSNSVVNRFLNSNDMELEEHTVERDKVRNEEIEENFKDRQEVERHNGLIESINEQRKEDMKELKSEKAEKEESVAKEVQKVKELVDNNKECERIEASKEDKKICTAKGDNNDSCKTLPAETCDKEQQKIANRNQEVKPLEKPLKAAEHPARGSALVMRERLRRAIGITEGMVAHAKASDPASKQESGKEREADSVTRSDRARVEENL